MISSIKGICVDITGESVIIEVGGVGMEVFVTVDVLCRYARLGQEMQLYTFLKVAEDSLSLFGFRQKSELHLFKKLITVSGIGAKGGMNLLSYFNVHDLVLAIVREDVKELSKVHGIGAKTAKRIILDLKDKMEHAGLTTGIEMEESSALVSGESGAKKEALDALLALGYSNAVARKAIAKVEDVEDADAETILKLSLKYLI